MKKLLFGLLLISSFAQAQRIPNLTSYTGSADSAYFNGYIGSKNHKILGIDIAKAAFKDTASFDTVDVHSLAITPRIGTTTTSSTPTPNADENDQFNVTALAANATFAAPAGTPNDGQLLTIRIKDNGTARTLSWSSIYRGSTDFSLPSTTVINKTMYLRFMYNAADTKWDCITLTQGF